jgi:tRNA(His) guanylyltransferase
MQDSLGDRMKQYEQVWQHRFPRRLPLIIRVDGRGFHRYLRAAEKPFDMEFVEQMSAVATAMCQDIDGAVFAYHQSDEISLLVCDYPGLNTEPWFGGGLQKIVSVAASVATTQLAWHRRDRPMFDARAFVMPDAVETVNYFVWRQKDAKRNAVSMAARSMFSHQQLHGVNITGMKQMMADAGTNFDDYPPQVQRGQQVRHVEWTPRQGTVTDNGDGSRTLSWPEPRHHWETEAAWDFKADPDNLLAQLVPSTSVFDEPVARYWIKS